jgi:NADPH-dependent curcumin reductase CurA
MMAATVVDRPEVEVRIAMAGLAVPDGKASWLVLTGDHDGIAYSAETATTFGDQPAPSRLGVIRGAGHLAFSDLCTLGRDRGGVLAIAKAHGVAVPEIVGQLAMDGCRDTDAPFATTAPVIRALTAGVLEEKLRCDAAAADALANLAKSAPITMVENR